MMRLTFAALLLISATASAQLSISFTTGYASNAMASMKGLQEEFKRDFPVEPKITESFPSYWYYCGQFNYAINGKLAPGLAFSYGSTAGRVQYNDYSGGITADQLLTYMSIGAPLRIPLNPKSKSVTVNFEVTPSLIFTSLDLQFKSQLGTEKDHVSHKFSSTNISIQPAFMLMKRMKFIGIFIQAGYNLNIANNELKFKENKEYYLQNNDGDKVVADWSGFRASVGLTCFISGNNLIAR